MGTFGKDFGETLPEYVSSDHARSPSRQRGNLASQNLLKILTFIDIRNVRLSCFETTNREIIGCRLDRENLNLFFYPDFFLPI